MPPTRREIIEPRNCAGLNHEAVRGYFEVAEVLASILSGCQIERQKRLAVAARGMKRMDRTHKVLSFSQAV